MSASNIKLVGFIFLLFSLGTLPKIAVGGGAKADSSIYCIMNKIACNILDLNIAEKKNLAD